MVIISGGIFTARGILAENPDEKGVNIVKNLAMTFYNFHLSRSPDPLRTEYLRAFHHCSTVLMLICLAQPSLHFLRLGSLSLSPGAISFKKPSEHCARWIPVVVRCSLSCLCTLCALGRDRCGDVLIVTSVTQHPSSPCACDCVRVYMSDRSQC
jgi:hypothetical protein